MKCEMCGLEVREPTDCGLYIPECPVFGIGREEYDKLYPPKEQRPEGEVT